MYMQVGVFKENIFMKIEFIQVMLFGFPPLIFSQNVLLGGRDWDGNIHNQNPYICEIHM